MTAPSGSGQSCGELTQQEACEGPPCYTTSFRPIRLHDSLTNGVTVKGQNLSAGTPIILHPGFNKWKLVDWVANGELNGVIQLEDNPGCELAIDDFDRGILNCGGPSTVWRVKVNPNNNTAFQLMVAGPVNCGGHSALVCEDCPDGNGATWCNGDCSWDDSDGVCKGDLGIGLSPIDAIEVGGSLIAKPNPTMWFW